MQNISNQFFICQIKFGLIFPLCNKEQIIMQTGFKMGSVNDGADNNTCGMSRGCLKQISSHTWQSSSQATKMDW